MADLGELGAALASVSRTLDAHGVKHMVIGGLAAINWTRPRFTDDIDVTVRLPEDRLEVLIECIPDLGSSRVSDPAGFAERARVLPLRLADGTDLDLLIATVAFEHEAIDRAVLIDLGPGVVPMCRPEDLILYKVVSRRPVDQSDVSAILAHQREIELGPLREKVRELSLDLEAPAILERFDAAVHAAGRDVQS